jgi:hypothetical protein
MKRKASRLALPKGVIRAIAAPKQTVRAPTPQPNSFVITEVSCCSSEDEDDIFASPPPPSTATVLTEENINPGLETTSHHVPIARAEGSSCIIKPTTICYNTGDGDHDRHVDSGEREVPAITSRDVLDLSLEEEEEVGSPLCSQNRSSSNNNRNRDKTDISSASVPCSCLVCDVKIGHLSDLERTLHVNRCLDSQQAPVVNHNDDCTSDNTSHVEMNGTGNCSNSNSDLHNSTAVHTHHDSIPREERIVKPMPLPPVKNIPASLWKSSAPPSSSSSSSAAPHSITVVKAKPMTKAEKKRQGQLETVDKDLMKLRMEIGELDFRLAAAHHRKIQVNKDIKKLIRKQNTLSTAERGRDAYCLTVESCGVVSRLVFPSLSTLSSVGGGVDDCEGSSAHGKGTPHTCPLWSLSHLSDSFDHMVAEVCINAETGVVTGIGACTEKDATVLTGTDVTFLTTSKDVATPLVSVGSPLSEVNRRPSSITTHTQSPSLLSQFVQIIDENSSRRRSNIPSSQLTMVGDRTDLTAEERIQHALSGISMEIQTLESFLSASFAGTNQHDTIFEVCSTIKAALSHLDSHQMTPSAPSPRSISKHNSKEGSSNQAEEDEVVSCGSQSPAISRTSSFPLETTATLDLDLDLAGIIGDSPSGAAAVISSPASETSLCSGPPPHPSVGVITDAVGSVLCQPHTEADSKTLSILDIGDSDITVNSSPVAYKSSPERGSILLSWSQEKQSDTNIPKQKPTPRIIVMDEGNNVFSQDSSQSVLNVSESFVGGVVHYVPSPTRIPTPSPLLNSTRSSSTFSEQGSQLLATDISEVNVVKKESSSSNKESSSPSLLHDAMSSFSSDYVLSGDGGFEYDAMEESHCANSGEDDEARDDGTYENENGGDGDDSVAGAGADAGATAGRSSISQSVDIDEFQTAAHNKKENSQGRKLKNTVSGVKPAGTSLTTTEDPSRPLDILAISTKLPDLSLYSISEIHLICEAYGLRQTGSKSSLINTLSSLWDRLHRPNPPPTAQSQGNNKSTAVLASLSQRKASSRTTTCGIKQEPSLSQDVDIMVSRNTVLTFIQSNTRMYEDVLSFVPLDVQVVHTAMKACNVAIGKQELQRILDEEGIFSSSIGNKRKINSDSSAIIDD